MKRLLKISVLACFFMICNLFISATPNSYEYPTVYVFPKNQTVNVGQKVKIFTAISGRVVTMRILHHNIDVTNNSYYVKNKDVEIDAIQKSDEGPYYFQVTGPEGSTTEVAYIYVNDPLQPYN